MDPLSRSPEETGSARPASFYRGFFDAQQRRPVRNADPTLGQSLASALLAALPFAAIGFFLLRRRARVPAPGAPHTPSGGFMSGVMEEMQKHLNPLPSRDFRVEVRDTSFADVIGLPEAVAEVRQYVQFLRAPTHFTRLGARLPKGCLLTGAPGTGKTLLARAVAGEAGVAFFACSGADFVEVYAGSGPRRVRELFAAARAAAPSVVFVDEMDAIGARGGGGGVAGEENRTINQLLAELDGMRGETPVVVLAATNFPDRLDAALLRAGRFDRRVELPLPDAAARADLFAHFLRRTVHTGGEAAAAQLAAHTAGVSPATIAAVVNEAALSAALRGAAAVDTAALHSAVDDVLVGRRRRRRRTGTARAAWREGGRGMVAWLLPSQPRVLKVSIAARGAHHAGFTRQSGREALDTRTAQTLFTDLCVAVAGRVAEGTRYPTHTSADAEDCQGATDIAMRQFLAFGMSRRVGLLAFEPQRLTEGREAQRHSEETQKAAETEAKRLLAVAEAFTRELLRTHEETLHRLAAELEKREELSPEDLTELIGPSGTATLSASAQQALEAFVQKAEETKLV